MTKVCIIGHGDIGRAIEVSLNQQDIANLYIYDKKAGVLDDDKLSSADIMFICTPTSALSEVLNLINIYRKPESLTVTLSKGIDKTTGKLVHELMTDFLPSNDFAILAGPMLAQEISNGMGGVGVLASKNQEVHKIINNIFNNKILSVKYSDDLAGVALFSVLKNIYTLAIGIVTGLSYGKNIQGWITARSFSEWPFIASKLGIKFNQQTADLILSDFIATSSSPLSQNRTAGIQIAEGKKPHPSEGLTALPLVVKRLNDDLSGLPVLEILARIILQKADPRSAIDKIL